MEITYDTLVQWLDKLVTLKAEGKDLWGGDDPITRRLGFWDMGGDQGVLHSVTLAVLKEGRGSKMDLGPLCTRLGLASVEALWESLRTVEGRNVLYTGGTDSRPLRRFGET